jgi:uncharacterized membrane protein
VLELRHNGNDRNVNVLDMDRGTKEKKLTAKQYEKLAEWGERAALVGLGSLVVQQIVNGASIISLSVITGAVVTALTYYQAYLWLKKAKSE